MTMDLTEDTWLTRALARILTKTVEPDEPVAPFNAAL